jgi:hypothetical protein
MAPAIGWANPIGVMNTQALSFGKFSAGTGGTITLNPSGTRNASGGVALLASDSGAPAQFIVSGDPSMTFAISLPADGTVALTSGTHNMSITAFLSSPSGIGQLSAGGTQTISVGATLNVGGNQSVGNYSGSFDVMVDYN